jgi:hypothetical protein
MSKSPNLASPVRATVAFAALTSIAVCQSFTWIDLGNGGPSNRRGHAAAYDSVRGRTTFFGGGIFQTGFADTWEWDGYSWSEATPATSPQPRLHHSMVFDAARGRIIMFGGQDENGFRYGDTWEWDGQSWTQRNGGPVARSRHAMAYDSGRSVVVLFGGSTSNPVDLADTWEWNGQTWIPRLTTTFPPAMSGHKMAYDPQSGRTVCAHSIFGLTQTWEWNGTNWVAFPTVQLPSISGVQHLHYEPSVGSVIYTGVAGSFVANWNGASWVQMQMGQGVVPMCMNGAASANDSRGALLIHGGQCAGSPNMEHWQLARFTQLANASTYGNGCGSPQLQIVPDLRSRPTLGGSAKCLINNSPTSLAAVTLGWSKTQIGPFPLPLPLDGFGLAGCSLLHSAEVTGLAPSQLAAGSLGLAIAIPQTSSLLGVIIHLQGYSYAPQANPAEIITSNGLSWTIGDF